MQPDTKCSTFGKVREAWLISKLTFGYWQRTWCWGTMISGGTFLSSLNEELKRELAARELPKSLNALISMCVRMDDHMQEYGERASSFQRPHGGFVSGDQSPETRGAAEEEEQPMQLGRAQLSPSDCRRWQRACEWCFCVLFFSVEKGH